MQTVSTTRVLRIASVRSEATGSEPYYCHTHLAIPTAEGLHVLPLDEILHCQADSNYCILHCRHSRKIVVSKTLKYIESMLPKTVFIRVHQSHVIRFMEIQCVQRDQILLSNGVTIPLSRNWKAALSDHIEAFANRL